MATELLRSSSWQSGRRATDTDRNDTCRFLDSALAEGQLSMEEHRQRAAWRARDPQHEAVRREEHLSDHRAEQRSDHTPGALDIDIYVSSDFGGGYIELNADGTTKQVNYPS